ncbi:hypothetical protein [Leifsonia xyli]|uniref:hypothetical protein n=1 Tax=Leifsonia xyli TaxID=1575 RepID=UPI003D67EC7A
MSTPNRATDDVPLAAQRDRTRTAIWVLSSLLALAVLGFLGALFVNHLFSDSLSSAYKKPLHVVESQLQLDAIGKVVINREFDNSGWRPLGLGGANMQADVTITGTKVRDRLSARLRSLGYDFHGTTGADVASAHPTDNWKLGDGKIRVVERPYGADLVLLVSSE